MKFRVLIPKKEIVTLLVFLFLAYLEALEIQSQLSSSIRRNNFSDENSAHFSNRIPIEIYAEISRKFLSLKDVCHCAQVSHSWKRVTNLKNISIFGDFYNLQIWRSNTIWRQVIRKGPMLRNVAKNRSFLRKKLFRIHFAEADFDLESFSSSSELFSEKSFLSDVSKSKMMVMKKKEEEEEAQKRNSSSSLKEWHISFKHQYIAREKYF